MGMKFRAFSQKSPLLGWLVSLNLLALLGWGVYGVWNLIATRRQEEEDRQVGRKAFQQIGGLSKEDAERFQAAGRNFKLNRKGSDEDVDYILKILDGDTPGSPERYTNPKHRAMTVLCITQLAEIRNMTPEQEERIARRMLPLPPKSDDAFVQILYKIVKAFSRKMKTESARRILENAVGGPA